MSGENSIFGRYALSIESVIIALLSAVYYRLPLDWTHSWIFEMSVIGMFVFLLFRMLVEKADSPNLAIAKGSIRWSAMSLHLAVIGAMISISTRLSEYAMRVEPIEMFLIISLVLTLLIVVLDQTLLREYAGTWSATINENTGDNLVGEVLREVGDFGKDRIEAAMRNDTESAPRFDLRKSTLIVALLLTLFLITLPIWVILGYLFGNPFIGMLVLLSVLVIRDLVRYTYLNYGAASSLPNLKYGLKYEFIWTLLLGGLLAAALGFDVPFIP